MPGSHPNVPVECYAYGRPQFDFGTACAYVAENIASCAVHPMFMDKLGCRIGPSAQATYGDSSRNRRFMSSNFPIGAIWTETHQVAVQQITRDPGTRHIIQLIRPWLAGSVSGPLRAFPMRLRGGFWSHGQYGSRKQECGFRASSMNADGAQIAGSAAWAQRRTGEMACTTGCSGRPGRTGGRPPVLASRPSGETGET